MARLIDVALNFIPIALGIVAIAAFVVAINGIILLKYYSQKEKDKSDED